MNKPTTPELIEILDDAIEKGLSITELAKKIGYSKQYLFWLIRITPRLQNAKKQANKQAKAKSFSELQGILDFYDLTDEN